MLILFNTIKYIIYTYYYNVYTLFLQDHKEFIKKSKDPLITRSAKELSLLQYHEVEPHLQSNPFILSGYRGSLTTKMCIERHVENYYISFGF